MPLSFDEAIEILEIADLDNVDLSNLKNIEKRAKKRWHPDRISHLNDEALTEKYKETFQKITPAIQLIRKFLKGEFHGERAFSDDYQEERKEPHETIRENASNIQSTLKDLWSLIKQHQFKMKKETVVFSDGFSWREYIEMDFREEIATLSIISFFSYLFSFGLIAFIFLFIFPPVAAIIVIFGAFLLLFCVLGFLPLSRLWLPNWLTDIMIWFINFGLSVQHNLLTFLSRNIIVNLYLGLISLFAKAIKWIILFPLYQIAMASVGDRRGGVVKQITTYYAGVAEWEIKELLNKQPSAMSPNELYVLSHLYTELLDVKRL